MGRSHRSKKSRRAPAGVAPQMMLMPQSPFMCMPGMPQIMQQQLQPQAEAPQEGESSSQTSDSSDTAAPRKRVRCQGKDDKSSKAQVSHAGGLMMEVPKVRKSEALEEVCSTLDATSTADLAMASMDKLLWLLTHVRPNTKLADLRCITWRDLYRKLQLASNDRSQVQKHAAGAGAHDTGDHRHGRCGARLRGLSFLFTYNAGCVIGLPGNT